MGAISFSFLHIPTPQRIYFFHGYRHLAQYHLLTSLTTMEDLTFLERVYSFFIYTHSKTAPRMHINVAEPVLTSPPLRLSHRTPRTTLSLEHNTIDESWPKEQSPTQHTEDSSSFRPVVEVLLTTGAAAEKLMCDHTWRPRPASGHYTMCSSYQREWRCLFSAVPDTKCSSTLLRYTRTAHQVFASAL